MPPKPPTARETATHIYFYGHSGANPYICFSQHHYSSFTDPPPDVFVPTSSNNEPRFFLTAEHYMMYQKALLMHDAFAARSILSCKTPREAKALGRKVKNFDQKLWERECVDIVTRGNYLRFSQNERLRRILLGTGDKKLVEASPHDRIWGVGFDTFEAEGKEARWGTNLLGKCLEAVRARLRKEEEETRKREDGQAKLQDGGWES